jgi:hypothetical protein
VGSDLLDYWLWEDGTDATFLPWQSEPSENSKLCVIFKGQTFKVEDCQNSRDVHLCEKRSMCLNILCIRTLVMLVTKRLDVNHNN